MATPTKPTDAPGNRRKPSGLPKLKKARRGRPFAKGNTLGRRFQPGQSGNPDGRPASVKETQEYASTFSREAVETLVLGMRQTRNLPERRLCAIGLLDRANGKPAQPIVGDDDADAIRVEGSQLVVDLLRKLAGEKTE